MGVGAETDELHRDRPCLVRAVGTQRRHSGLARAAGRHRHDRTETDDRGWRPRDDRIGQRQAANLPRPGIPRHGFPARRARIARSSIVGNVIMPTPVLTSQLINLGAALLLLSSFAMLSQRRILSLVNLFALQGAVLSISTAIVA